MRQLIEVFLFLLIGVVLLWFGYTLFVTVGIPSFGRGVFGGGSGRKRRSPRPRGESSPGEAQTCPVCSAKLSGGELVSSVAFPSLNGGKDRFMHIRGCLYCIGGDRDRVCPVCGVLLKGSDILICRLFERPGRRSHVHVLGCTGCKGIR